MTGHIVAGDRERAKGGRGARGQSPIVAGSHTNRRSLALRFWGQGAHILLEVYAPWCSHCQHFEPTFNSLAAQLIGRGAGTSGIGTGAQGPVVVARMDGYQNRAHSGYECQCSRVPHARAPREYRSTPARHTPKRVRLPMRPRASQMPARHTPVRHVPSIGAIRSPGARPRRKRSCCRTTARHTTVRKTPHARAPRRSAACRTPPSCPLCARQVAHVAHHGYRYTKTGQSRVRVYQNWAVARSSPPKNRT